MIPKIIHYVWVGDKEKPDSVKKCIASWKKYCPDWQIKEWGNDTLKKINNAYVSEAFEAKKWAFVSDYIRLYALYEQGGIYLDTDEELCANIDEFINNDFIISHENYHGSIGLSMGFIGAAKKHKIIKDMLAVYDGLHFKIKENTFDQKPCPARFAPYFEKHFIFNAKHGDAITKLQDGCFVYPWWYFCTPLKNKKTYAIHHYDGTWLDTYKRKAIFTFKNWKFVKFKKNKYAPENTLPLYDGEIIKYKYHCSSYKVYALIKESK
ncbi:MAG: glycosyl transferase [Alphaproteobacteria bacterium]|nr:glycosyl transferase [Alphaproteobacteria bacterium]